MPTVTVNEVQVQVPEGTTALQAARLAGVHVPTLCHLDHVHSVGACRVCLVEVQGARGLAASCVTPVFDGMKIQTNTQRVREARRAVVELLLSEHDGDCQTCVRNDDCELQQLARDCGIRKVTYTGERRHQHFDRSTPALVRDSAKCVLCRRCATVCSSIQSVGALVPQDRGFETTVGPAFCKPLSDVVCVQCGQCSAVCPVAAITENEQIDEVWAALSDPTKHVVVQTAPAIRASIAECFGNPAGTLATGKMVTALRKLGFQAVFDTDFSADLTIIEEGNELLTRLRKAVLEGDKSVRLPMFTSCCPGWIKFAETYYPDLLGNLSSCKSPQQMMGALIKTVYAQRIGRKPEDIFVVSIMPCTAKKYECSREEMCSGGARDVDVVLTTRELGRMIKQAGIDFNSLPDGLMDDPFGESTGAADIFANTGGVMEAALRTAYELVTGRPLPLEAMEHDPEALLEGVKKKSIQITDAAPEWSFLNGQTVGIAVVHGLANARNLIERIKAGENGIHFVEVMTCPGGCIGGGGQPRMTDREARVARIRAIEREDQNKPLRKSHANPAVTRLYEEFLGSPLGHKSHELLHTKYRARPRI